MIPLLLVGASAGCDETNCSIAGPDWPDHVGPWLPMPTAYPQHAELRMGSGGQIELRLSGLGLSDGWEHVSETKLREHMGLISSTNPAPYLVVDVSPDAPCERVNSLSRELERFPMCREGRCLERSAWLNYKSGPS